MIVFSLLAGVLGGNALPHFVRGITNRSCLNLTAPATVLSRTSSAAGPAWCWPH
jgi:hypothetical protein